MIELLVVVAVVAILLGILLPAIGAAREAGRGVKCAAQLRQAAISCLAYANENDGRSPALGQPYTALPAWPLVVLRDTGREAAGTQLYSGSSVLSCPSASGFYGRAMQRTYAINCTGHAGAPATTDALTGAAVGADPDNFDAPGTTAHIRVDRVARPSDAVLMIDSAVPPGGSVTGAPPPTRTIGTVDFRQESHRRDRVGRFHGSARSAFNAVMFDTSTRGEREVRGEWMTALP